MIQSNTTNYQSSKQDHTKNTIEAQEVEKEQKELTCLLQSLSEQLQQAQKKQEEMFLQKVVSLEVVCQIF